MEGREEDIPGSRGEGWKVSPDELIGMRDEMPTGYSQRVVDIPQSAF